MNKRQIYKELESKMLDYSDYAEVPVIENGEPLVPIPTTDNLYATQYRTEMLPYTGDQVYVRANVARRLGQAATLVASKDSGLKLEVCYGYRALEIQRKNFEIQKEKLSDHYSGDSLMAAAHRLVAVPEVAGHPAGAAVDIRITRDGMPLDFGTDIWQFVPDSYMYSPFISSSAARNRALLRNAMLACGFAPYDGEWWHFSYGDKEWAKYYDSPIAYYSQLDFRSRNE